MQLRLLLVMLVGGLVTGEASAFGRRRHQNCNVAYSQQSYNYSYQQECSSQNFQPLQVLQPQQQFQYQQFGFQQQFQSFQTGSFQQLLSLHNSVRAMSGLHPLMLDPQLCNEAQQSAFAQAQRGRVGHFLGLSGGSENSAQGQTSEWEAHSSWMSSGGHRANVVGRQWSRVGFGMAYGPNGPYWAARYR